MQERWSDARTYEKRRTSSALLRFLPTLQPLPQALEKTRSTFGTSILASCERVYWDTHTACLRCHFLRMEDSSHQAAPMERCGSGMSVRYVIRPLAVNRDRRASYDQAGQIIRVNSDTMKERGVSKKRKLGNCAKPGLPNCFQETLRCYTSVSTSTRVS